MKWDLEAGFGRGKCGWRCEVDAKVGRVDVASGGGRWTRVVEGRREVAEVEEGGGFGRWICEVDLGGASVRWIWEVDL